MNQISYIILLHIDCIFIPNLGDWLRRAVDSQHSKKSATQFLFTANDFYILCHIHLPIPLLNIIFRTQQHNNQCIRYKNL